MSSFGEEYVELDIVISSTLKYTFDLSIDVIDFCEKENINCFDDFEWVDIQKFIQTYFNIELNNGDDAKIQFTHEISRNIWSEFDIRIECLSNYRYDENETIFTSLIRQLKIKKALE